MAKFKRGQAMVEYVIALVGMLAVVVAMGFLLRAEKSAAERTNALVASPYP